MPVLGGTDFARDDHVNIAGDLHPTLQPDVEHVLSYLAALYPWVAFEGVEVFRPRRGDESLGYAKSRKIHLNGFWFSRPAKKLKLAAFGNARRAFGPPSWHAGMPEPHHTLVHEFGHVFADSAGRSANRFAADLYAEAIRDPAETITGYALANPAECFAEHFAAAHLDVPRETAGLVAMRRWLRMK